MKAAVIKTAHATELPIAPLSENCTAHKAAIQKYFGDYTTQALKVSTAEAGCEMKRSYGANKNGTYDWCMFQINNEPSVLKDIDKCARRAFEKFKGSGYDWAQWYAVCPVIFIDGKRVQYQKFQDLKCK